MTMQKKSPAVCGTDRAEADLNGNVQQTLDNPTGPDDQDINDLPPPWLDAGPYLPPEGHL